MKTKYSSSAGTAYVTYENCIVPKKYIIKGENKASKGSRPAEMVEVRNSIATNL